jgi:hypothetical protein
MQNLQLILHNVGTLQYVEVCEENDEVKER